MSAEQKPKNCSASNTCYSSSKRKPCNDVINCKGLIQTADKPSGALTLKTTSRNRVDLIHTNLTVDVRITKKKKNEKNKIKIPTDKSSVDLSQRVI